MKITNKEFEDEIFNKFIILEDKQNDGIKQLASSICLDRNTFVEYVKSVGVNIFDYFYKITISNENSLILELTSDRKHKFQMRLNATNQIYGF